MTTYATTTSNTAVTPYPYAPGNPYAACDSRMCSNRYVVTNLNLVINLDTFFNKRIAQRSTINGRVSPYFYIILDYDCAKLWNLEPTPVRLLGNTEAIRSYHYSCMYNNVIADNHPLI